MTSLPDPVQKLIHALGTLPGVGPRSAERLALHVVQAEPGEIRRLAEALVQAVDQVHPCSRCGSLTDRELCPICDSNNREATQVCVVERAVDVLKIEKPLTYRGRYHVLGGRLSPLNGIGPDDLRIASLEQRIPAEGIQEVILALGTDVEGDATAVYLAGRLTGLGVRVTRLAHGLPAGSGLEYADELTLSRALSGRQPVQ